MDTRDLRYFQVLLRHRSARAAAQELFISPQGLRKGIKRLETALNCNLFDPKLSSWRLTEEGEAFRSYADQVLSETGRLEEQIHAIKEKTERIVRVVTTPHVKELISPRISDFHLSRPEVKVDITESVDSLCEARLLDERYAFGILQAPFDMESYQVTPIYEKNFAVWVRSEEAQGFGGSIRLRDMAGKDIALLDDTHKAYDSFINACVAAGFAPHIVEKTDLVWIVEHVRTQGGFGLTLPQYPTYEGLSMLSIQDFSWKIGICRPKDRILSHDALLFAQHLEEGICPKG